MDRETCRPLTFGAVMPSLALNEGVSFLISLHQGHWLRGIGRLLFALASNIQILFYGTGLRPIDIQDSNCRRDVIHEFPESNLGLVGWPGGMN